MKTIFFILFHVELIALKIRNCTLVTFFGMCSMVASLKHNNQSWSFLMDGSLKIFCFLFPLHSLTWVVLYCSTTGTWVTSTIYSPNLTSWTAFVSSTPSAVPSPSSGRRRASWPWWSPRRWWTDLVHVHWDCDQHCGKDP